MKPQPRLGGRWPLLTASGYANLLKQLNWREQYERPRIKTQLVLTRALGDLSENADYQISRLESKINENKINEIKMALNSAEISAKKPRANRIGFNTTLVVKDQLGKLKTYTIVGDNEIVVSPESIGLSSLVAKELIFKKRGDTVVFSEAEGDKICKILFIISW
ncbi:GreA/GreB family elongation factor [Candidatus Hodgkinia cicadicola]